MSNAVALGWPSGTDTGWPSEPRNMLPGRIEGYPQGTQRSANTAERLLSQAVGWWDAAAYRDGDRLLRNRGVAGELLDLQLGSSDRVATTNDPLFLAPEESGYVFTPYNSGLFLDGLTVQHADVTWTPGDLDIRVRVAPVTFATPGSQVFISKYRSLTAGERVFLFQTAAFSTQRLELVWSINGTTGVAVESTTGVGVAGGQPLWLRATLDTDNAGEYEVRFYRAADSVDEPTAWVQIGSTVVGTTGPTSVFAGTDNFKVASRTDGVAPYLGKSYRAIIKDGIDGTTVLDIDCDAITDGSATSFQAVTGQTVRINRSPSGRKAVAVPSRSLKKWDDPHVYLPGVNGNFLSVPDAAALDITGDLDIRVKVALAAWTPAAVTGLASKWLTTGNQRSYSFRVNTNGALRLVWSENGTAEISKDSTVANSFGANSVQWVRVTLDVDNGASGNDVKFFTSNDGVNWIQLGTTVTTAGVTSVYSSTADLSIGQVQASTNMATGGFYQSVIYSDLTETTKVLDIDCGKAPTNFTAGNTLTFLADTGQTVTLNSTAGSNMEVRGTRFSSGRSLFLLGTDDFFQCVGNWQHQLLNFEQQDSFTVLTVHRMSSFTATQAILSKKTSPSELGYGWRNGTGTPAQNLFEFSDGAINQAALPVTSRTANTLTVSAAVRATTSRTARAWLNGTTGTPQPIGLPGSIANSEAFRIGRLSGSGTNYADMELTSAAVFRRALTPDEIKTITDYYQNRGY